MLPGRAGTAGIILAGGKSSRMGQNKALMNYRGKSWIDHMEEMLRQAGCADVHISGEIAGYDCIPDAVRHDGPARAMLDLLRYFEKRYERLLFAPVDMPLIQVNSLRHLLSQNGSVYYKEHPLPACIMTGDFGSSCSVREVLVSAGAVNLDIRAEWKEGMANVNTKKEWEDITS